MDKGIINAFQLAKQLDDVEVEARIKGPIVREDTAKRLLARYGIIDGDRYTEQRNKATSGTQAVVYRCINDENIICKTKIKSTKWYNEWVSIVISTEIDTGSNEMLSEKHFTKTTKTRYSVELYPDVARLDVTHFHDDDIYQVEVEALEYYHPDLFSECVRTVVDILQDSPMYISRKRFDAVRCIVGGEGNYFSTTANINKKGSIDVDRTTPFSIYRGKYQKPVTLTRRRLRDIFRKDIFMTPKLDGVRRFIVTFNGMIYDVDPEHMHVRLLGNSPYTQPFPSILDAELVSDTYNIFDICAFEGWYVGNETLLSRIEYMKTWLESVKGNYNIKEYEKLEVDPVEQINQFYQRHLISPIDGIVFVNGNQEYTGRVLKWKERVTIDLIMDKDGILEDRITANSVDTTLLVKKDDNTFVDGTGVYEFEVLGMLENDETTLFDLKVLRYRDDKKKPNSSNVIKNNVDGLLLQDIWNGHGCILMRQYHNAVKRKILSSYAKGSVVLDVGSGQGGDVSKWKDARKVYCVEPNADAIKELKRRLSGAGMKKHVKVIHSTISNTEKVYKHVKKVDIITLFFTINLFLQQDLDGLMEIVKKYQPKHIIGTFLDKSSLKFGDNTCYKIISKDSSGYRIHLPGTRINQDEYFFSLNQLHFVGYKLVDSRPLDYGEIMSTNEKELSAMFYSFHYCR